MTVGIMVMIRIGLTTGRTSIQASQIAIVFSDWLFANSQSVLRRRFVRRVLGEDRQPDGMVVDLLQQRLVGGRVSVAGVIPRIEMNQRFWRQTLRPVLARENRAVGKLADIADA